METKEKQTNSIDGEELTEALVLIRTRAPDLESVRKLNCWACNIRDVSVVRRMPNLEVCSLTINKLTSLRDFAHCQNLQELYVRTNNIQKLSDIHYLKNLKKLRSLWLSENPCASGVNYRMTVLKTLPILQKLDNIAVTGDEIARAEQEGDDLPLPDDFSFSSVFKDSTFTSSSEDCRVEKNEESMSVSSEKWARPREKRQQKKREGFWKERRQPDEGCGSAKSSDDSGGSDVGSHNMRSSSDGANCEDWYKPKVEAVMGSAKSDVTGQGQDIEKIEIDYPGKDQCLIADEEAKTEQSKDSSKRDNLAVNIGISDSKESSTKANRAIRTDILDKMTESEEKDDKDKNDNEIKIIEETIDENKYVSDCQKKTFEKENNEKAFVRHSSIENVFSVSSESFNPSAFYRRNEDEWQCIKNSPPVDCEDSDLTQISSISKDPLDLSSIAFNNRSNSTISLISDISHIREDHSDVSSLATSTKGTEQAETPLLDKAMLEDSLEMLDSAEDQACSRDTLEAEGSADLSLEIDSFEKFGLSSVSSTPAAETEAINIQPVAHSVGESKEPVNWNEYNRMRVQLGIRPVDRISTTSRSVNTELSKAKNSNILQAVLCLVKELDKDSLDIVASTVKGRLDSL